jgi:hypothetical protein
VPWSSAASTTAVPWLSGGDDVTNAEDWRRSSPLGGGGDTDGQEVATEEGEAVWGVDAVIL